MYTTPIDARISRGTAIICTKALGMDTEPSLSTLKWKIFGVAGNLVPSLVPEPVYICSVGILGVDLSLPSCAAEAVELAPGNGVDAMTQL